MSGADPLALALQRCQGDIKEITMDQQMIPYFCHEGDMARAERTIKRLWILCILLIVLLVGTNIAWIHYENQFQDEVTVTQDSSTGVNNYLGGNGVITNGKTDGN